LEYLKLTKTAKARPLLQQGELLTAEWNQTLCEHTDGMTALNRLGFACGSPRHSRFSDENPFLNSQLLAFSFSY